MLAVPLAIELREQIEAGIIKYQDFEKMLKRDSEYPKNERPITSGIFRNNILKKANIKLSSMNSGGPLWKRNEKLEETIEGLRLRIVDLEENATRG